ncbi:DUF4097 domain-containing protein [Bacillus safensis]|uniref:DUF4097 family beta strand repeat-containing protein n=1 Tax=Bacillus TaxID=1386 RepID=UPI000D034C24|nr:MULTISPECIES: DUF4097 domain-containing protein [Bacillus]MBW4854329.1 DUF4097 domain-containing protein [Bacillaceae bacterium]MBW4857638.1 DUF4097 domain-containing protein [Bacillaceae bacterium]MCY7583031.1 DUF4097 domain-containing protein [Bacillus safensis]MCY7585998.1 DUF4097 domain-containing protein [Bacillus safensis]MCY7611049.1 DUF4097 domain-containing protein [Bacillus safensis]
MNEKERILKLVEDGVLSAKEAITLLEKLEEGQSVSLEKSTADHTFHEEKAGAGSKGNGTENLGAKLFGWLDTAVKKVKDVDLDLNFGQSVDVEHIFQFKDASLSHLDIQLANGSLNVMPWDDRDIRAECHAKIYRAEDGEQARQQFLNQLDCGLEGDKFFIRTEKKTMKVNVTLYVPRIQYDKIKVKLFNGPIRGEKLKTKELAAKTTNGVVSFASLQAEKVGIETANGQIKLADHECGMIEVETINGLIDLRGKSESIDAQSFNGNIAVQLSDEKCRSIYAKTTTGSVDVQIPRACAVTAELKSNLGSISHDLLDAEMIKEKNETLQKEKMIKANQQAAHSISIFAETKTGSIQVKHQSDKE